MIRRETLIDALALATLAVAAYAAWCALPGDAMATEIRPAPVNSDFERMAGLFMVGVIAAICIGIAAVAAIGSRWFAPSSTADEDEPAPEASAEHRARNAEGRE